MKVQNAWASILANRGRRICTIFKKFDGNSIDSFEP
jgi:hypothetical protein